MKPLIILVLIYTLLLLSCSKSKTEEKILGTWQEASLSAADSNKIISWTFFDNGQLILLHESPGDTFSITAHYTMETKSLQASNVLISDANDFVNGNYQIIKNNSKVLIIQRTHMASGETGAAYLFKEFFKIE